MNYQCITSRKCNSNSPVQCIASPMQMQNGDLRFCCDYHFYLNGKVMDEDYALRPQLQGAAFYDKIDLSVVYHQTNLMLMPEKCAQSTPNRMFKMRRLIHGLKISSSIFKNCIENTFKGDKGVIFFFEEDLLLYKTSREQYKNCMTAVVGRLKEKKVFFLLMSPSETQNLSQLFFWLFIFSYWIQAS